MRPSRSRFDGRAEPEMTEWKTLGGKLIAEGEDGKIIADQRVCQLANVASGVPIAQCR